MSLERAYMNCEKCFGLGEHYTSQRRYKLRNEVMKALEAELVRHKVLNEEVTTAEEALRLCRDCDYKSPNIVDFIKEIEKSE